MKSVLKLYDFSPVDWHVASAIADVSSGSSDELLLAVALVSKRCREGHVCASLPAVAGLPLSQTELGDLHSLQTDRWPPLQAWLNKLRESDAVTEPERLDPTRPLVLVADRLYLNRYYFHETALAERIRERVEGTLDVPAIESTVALLQQHFSPAKPGSEKQHLAIALALISRLCIITGGPGTGKTSTIVRLLAVLMERELGETGNCPRVVLLAPTGKAASRIAESIRKSKGQLSVADPIRDGIPDEAVTIHRALGLGARPDYSDSVKLAADIVVVDEASMVDIALMRRLFDACTRVPRLILLGDPEQLESVLAGSVLAELSSEAHAGYSRLRAQQLKALTGLEVTVNSLNPTALDDCRIELTESHRFASGSGIGKLSQAVRSGQGQAAWNVFSASKDEARFIELPPNPRASLSLIFDIAAAGYQSFLSAADPAEALAALNRFRILCGHRTGPLGAEAINSYLSSSSLVRQYLPNRAPLPILVTVNAPELSLYNGDVGVLYADPTIQSNLRAYFLGKAGELRAFSSSRLPAYELAFAMTVHKMQGSELDNVFTILPRVDSPLLTRELIYTAITRARRSCVLGGTQDAFIQGCQRKSHRFSGLNDALQNASWRPDAKAVASAAELP
jgi:exodeoxyribonuclease V alpha subunit